MERLLIGQTPYGTREIAYNNYRATDDVTEKQFIKDRELQARKSGSPLYDAIIGDPDVPETLMEEFELFWAMYRAVACYDLNTVLQRDPRIKDKMEAVAQTMKLIVAALEQRPAQARYTLDNYREFIKA
jgi:hypothetical protein